MPDTEMTKAVAALEASRAEVEALKATIKAEAAIKTDVDADVRALKRELTDVKAALELEVARNADPEEELLKGMSAPARKLFETQKAAHAKLLADLAKRDDENALFEIEKAFAADFPGLPVTATDAAPVMKAAVAAMGDEQVTLLRKMLKAGSDALTELTTIKGATGAPAPNSPEAELEKSAAALAIEKGITREAAYVQLLDADPARYALIRNDLH